jgi:hypothetical protein
MPSLDETSSHHSHSKSQAKPIAARIRVDLNT